MECGKQRDSGLKNNWKMSGRGWLAGLDNDLENYLGSELYLQSLAEHRYLYVFQGPDVECPRRLPKRVTPVRERLPDRSHEAERLS